MSRLGVVVNPVAGHGRGIPRGRKVLADLARSGHEVEDLSGADAAAARANARAALDRLDALVVVGGDGMVHLGVNVVAGSDVPLAVVAVGSGNDFARTLHLPTHDVEAAIALIERGLRRGPRLIDAIATRLHDGVGLAAETDDDGTHVEWTACVLSAGFDAAVNERANSYTWPRGGGRYVRGVLEELRSFVPYGYRLTIDGAVRELPGTLVALANASSIGGGMRIAPDALVDDGFIDVVIAGAVSRMELLRLFPRVYSGRHVHDRAVDVVRARDVLIEPLEGHPQPPHVFADGEPLGKLPMHATIHPGALRLLAEPAT